ncbi:MULTISPECIES: DUF2877 domain-containing protein [unclassified Exiguobacterium]|uniref:DUF2877 domain-containing protein n=1 Tax=unclassified Exiguobacterium TaxID=2644629 RepID=UPI001039ADB7|nr:MULTISPECIES: DUF2877 domain-containing protein [unclassified Exiguobacterium]TCI63253.1 DUF2877 domain-containing protein [Exiguobacterium sp. SH0S2]TCI71048.1 DUF2877 domain-containing protein [Exiguobacterium sp. SH0S7]
MRQIGAAYSTYAASLLQEFPQALQVEAVFRNGYNLRMGGHLIYIGTTKNGHTPFGIHVKTVDRLEWRVGDCLLAGIGATIHHVPSGITIYPDQVLKMNMERVEPKRYELALNLRQMEARLRELGHDWSYAYEERREPLYEYLTNIGQAEGKRLIGYGKGLTPSGDDVLIGYMAVCEVLGRPMKWQNDYVMTAKYRTTRSSVAFYEAALRGEYTSELKRLITVLLTESFSNCEVEWERLITFGSSSGQDTALGIYLALKQEMEELDR